MFKGKIVHIRNSDDQFVIILLAFHGFESLAVRAIQRIGDSQQDLDTENFAASRELTVGVPSISGQTKVGSVAFSDGAEIANIATGELFRVKVRCDTSDSMFTGDLELLALILRETA